MELALIALVRASKTSRGADFLFHFAIGGTGENVWISQSSREEPGARTTDFLKVRRCQTTHQLRKLSDESTRLAVIE
jgi:hypothetical protein